MSRRKQEKPQHFQDLTTRSSQQTSEMSIRRDDDGQAKLWKDVNDKTIGCISSSSSNDNSKSSECEQDSIELRDLEQNTGNDSTAFVIRKFIPNFNSPTLSIDSNSPPLSNVIEHSIIKVLECPSGNSSKVDRYEVKRHRDIYSGYPSDVNAADVTTAVKSPPTDNKSSEMPYNLREYHVLPGKVTHNYDTDNSLHIGTESHVNKLQSFVDSLTKPTLPNRNTGTLQNTSNFLAHLDSRDDQNTSIKLCGSGISSQKYSSTRFPSCISAFRHKDSDSERKITLNATVNLLDQPLDLSVKKSRGFAKKDCQDDGRLQKLSLENQKKWFDKLYTRTQPERYSQSQSVGAELRLVDSFCSFPPINPHFPFPMPIYGKFSSSGLADQKLAEEIYKLDRSGSSLHGRLHVDVTTANSNLPEDDQNKEKHSSVQPLLIHENHKTSRYSAQRKRKSSEFHDGLEVERREQCSESDLAAKCSNHHASSSEENVNAAVEVESTRQDSKEFTTMRCSCEATFDSLYQLAVHIEESGHVTRNLTSESVEALPKMVRGQDVWLSQGCEQAEFILRCVQCGKSFQTLAELTVHMIRTRHYVDIVGRDESKGHLVFGNLKELKKKNTNLDQQLCDVSQHHAVKKVSDRSNDQQMREEDIDDHKRTLWTELPDESPSDAKLGKSYPSITKSQISEVDEEMHNEEQLKMELVTDSDEKWSDISKTKSGELNESSILSPSTDGGALSLGRDPLAAREHSPVADKIRLRSPDSLLSGSKKNSCDRNSSSVDITQGMMMSKSVQEVRQEAVLDISDMENSSYCSRRIQSPKTRTEARKELEHPNDFSGMKDSVYLVRQSRKRRRDGCSQNGSCNAKKLKTRCIVKHDNQESRNSLRLMAKDSPIDRTSLSSDLLKDQVSSKVSRWIATTSVDETESTIGQRNRLQLVSPPPKPLNSSCSTLLAMKKFVENSFSGKHHMPNPVSSTQYSYRHSDLSSRNQGTLEERCSLLDNIPCHSFKDSPSKDSLTKRKHNGTVEKTSGMKEKKLLKLNERLMEDFESDKSSNKDEASNRNKYWNFQENIERDEGKDRESSRHDLESGLIHGSDTTFLREMSFIDDPFLHEHNSRVYTDNNSITGPKKGVTAVQLETVAAAGLPKKDLTDFAETEQCSTPEEAETVPPKYESNLDEPRKDCLRPRSPELSSSVEIKPFLDQSDDMRNLLPSQFSNLLTNSSFEQVC